MKALSLTLCAGLAWPLLAASQTTPAADPPRSLHDARLDVIKGNQPGSIVIIGAAKPAASAASAAAPQNSRAATPVTATAATAVATARPVEAPAPAAESTPLGQRVVDWFKSAPPPSGKPLSDARRGDLPSQGIAMPTAASKAASQPAGKGRPRPGE